MTTAGKLTTVLTFDCTNGNEPGGLTLGKDRNFYGVTFSGGGPGNGGTIFKLTPRGRLVILFRFTLNGSEGSEPVGLTQGIDGNFYGATYGGSLYGTLFKITPNGNLTTLYQFDFTHGAQPFAAPIQGADGNFYGMTYSGGAYGSGTIYKITPDGLFTLLYSFGKGTSDGAYPVTSLVQGKDGNFYGTTPYGGPDNDGTIFKITPAGDFTNLHNFVGSDGRSPIGLVQATDGDFYGGADYVGAENGYGLLFRMTTAGELTTLFSFDGTNGASPVVLVQDTNGSFFGTTQGGGDLDCDPTYGCGTVYTLSAGLRPFVETVPSSGKVGTKVTILGSNLQGASDVTFNGTAATFKVVSTAEITSTVPTGATSGTVNVMTPNGLLKSNIEFTVNQ